MQVPLQLRKAPKLGPVRASQGAEHHATLGPKEISGKASPSHREAQGDFKHRRERSLVPGDAVAYRADHPVRHVSVDPLPMLHWVRDLDIPSLPQVLRHSAFPRGAGQGRNLLDGLGSWSLPDRLQ